MCTGSMDLTGMLIIKARIGEEVRRVPIHNEDITYDELLLMLQRLFPRYISSTDEVVLKYMDEDNDLITIADGSDLMYAKAYNRILRITIFLKGKEIPPIDLKSIRSIRSELASLRDRINSVLDKLEDCYPESSGAQQQQPHSSQSSTKEEKQEVKPLLKHDPAMTAEFDPLSSPTTTNKNVAKEVKPNSVSTINADSFSMKENKCDTTRSGQAVGTVQPTLTQQASVPPSPQPQQQQQQQQQMYQQPIHQQPQPGQPPAPMPPQQNIHFQPTTNPVSSMAQPQPQLQQQPQQQQSYYTPATSYADYSRTPQPGVYTGQPSTAGMPPQPLPHGAYYSGQPAAYPQYPPQPYPSGNYR